MFLWDYCVCQQVGLYVNVSCAFLCSFLFVLSYSNVLLLYLIIFYFYYYCLETDFLVRERKGSRWEGKWGETGRSRGR